MKSADPSHSTADIPALAPKLPTIRIFFIPNALLLVYFVLLMAWLATQPYDADAHISYHITIALFVLVHAFVGICPLCYSLATAKALRRGDYARAKRMSRGARCGPVIIIFLLILWLLFTLACFLFIDTIPPEEMERIKNIPRHPDGTPVHLSTPHE